jgi:hypothetical protein
MPVTSISTPSHLIVDNSLLADLTNCFCLRNRSILPRERILEPLQGWLKTNLDALRPFAVDNILHTTTVVANEYLPHAGELGNHNGLTRQQIDRITTQVRGELQQFDVAPHMGNVKLLRFKHAPQKLVGVSGLSNNDLSLVLLGLELSKLNNNVIILSNDQDLLNFTAWINRYKACIHDEQNPTKLFGVRGLTYLDLVHRSCAISSDQMKIMIDHSFRDIFARLPGTDKGMDILNQIMEVRDKFEESKAIKRQNQEARA